MATSAKDTNQNDAAASSQDQNTPAAAPKKAETKPAAAPTLPERVIVPVESKLNITLGNATHLVKFVEGEIVTEAHKIKALIDAGIVKLEDEAKAIRKKL